MKKPCLSIGLSHRCAFNEVGDVVCRPRFHHIQQLSPSSSNKMAQNLPGGATAAALNPTVRPLLPFHILPHSFTCCPYC